MQTNFWNYPNKSAKHKTQGRSIHMLNMILLWPSKDQSYIFATCIVSVQYQYVQYVVCLQDCKTSLCMWTQQQQGHIYVTASCTWQYDYCVMLVMTSHDTVSQIFSPWSMSISFMFAGHLVKYMFDLLMCWLLRNIGLLYIIFGFIGKCTVL